MSAKNTKKYNLQSNKRSIERNKQETAVRTLRARGINPSGPRLFFCSEVSNLFVHGVRYLRKNTFCACETWKKLLKALEICGFACYNVMCYLVRYCKARQGDCAHEEHDGIRQGREQ